jgi:hypothetical protein
MNHIDYIDLEQFCEILKCPLKEVGHLVRDKDGSYKCKVHPEIYGAHIPEYPNCIFLELGELELPNNIITNTIEPIKVISILIKVENEARKAH